jgi:hypothetical protein
VALVMAVRELRIRPDLGDADEPCESEHAHA